MSEKSNKCSEQEGNLFIILLNGYPHKKKIGIRKTKGNKIPELNGNSILN